MDPQWRRWLERQTRQAPVVDFSVIILHPVTQELANVDGKIWKTLDASGRLRFEITLNDSQLYTTEEVDEQGFVLRGMGASESQSYYFPDIEDIEPGTGSDHDIATATLTALVQQGQSN